MASREVYLHLAHLTDPHRISHCLGAIGEQLSHLRWALQIHLICFLAHPVFVVQRLAGIDAHQYFLRPCVFRRKIMNIVCSYDRHTAALRYLQQLWQHSQLFRLAVILQFYVEVFLPQRIGIPLGRLYSPINVPRPHLDCQFRTHMTGNADKTIGKLRQYLLVDSRPVVKPLRIRSTGQFQQILIALIVPSQKNQMVTRIGYTTCFSVTSVSRRNVALATYDRFYPQRQGFGIEFHRPEQVTVVGNGQAVHAQLLTQLQQIVYTSGPIQQRVRCMRMQMNELRLGHVLCLPFLSERASQLVSPMLSTMSPTVNADAQTVEPNSFAITRRHR